ncbi:MAG: CDC48 family AAA ATPase [Methanosarcinaceae archaeon]|nr:CDC48 family AAA ATPase [Methanosarcinaceae archaeon]
MNTESATVYIGRSYGINVEDGVAKLHPEMMNYLGIKTGDTIEIQGEKTGYARVKPMDIQDMQFSSSDTFDSFFDNFFTTRGFSQNQNRPNTRYNILVNSNLRDAIGAYIGQGVTIKKVDAKPAKTVRLTAKVPIRITVPLDSFEQILKERFFGSVVNSGSVLNYSLSRGFSKAFSIPFLISKTDSTGPLIINNETKLVLERENIEVVSESADGRHSPSEVSSGDDKSGSDIIRYEDIGGLNRELDEIREVVELPLTHPELFEKVGVEPPKGILLYGPPGTGKTLIAKAIANETKSKFIPISGPEIVSKYYGESEQQLREKFEEAERDAPAIIFIDEIDSIAPKRSETQGETERRIVAQLLTLMDGMKSRGRVVVIATTNRPDSIDEALRRGGRFDREIEIGVPDKEGRLQILKIHTKNMPLALEESGTGNPELSETSKSSETSETENFENSGGSEKFEDSEKSATSGDSGKSVDSEKSDDSENSGDSENSKVSEKPEITISDIEDRMNIHKSDAVDLDLLAEKTHGFVGSDLSSLCKEAAMNSIRRLIPVIGKDSAPIPEEVVNKLKVTREDFEKAFENMEPSAMREAYVEVPNVKWSDVGGLGSEKQELIEAVEWPLKYPDAFRAIGITPPKGILLYGPPGTGKTLLAKAVASESGANFISIKGPELFNKYVGETEKNIRAVFKRAKQAAPTVIFFDEIDAIASVRTGSSTNPVQENAVSQILTELDGVEELKNVVVIASTNRPDIIDPALLRPGRFDRLVYVKPPTKEGRIEIFKVHLKDKKLSSNVNIEKLAEETEGYVGADIEAICKEAAMLAMRDLIKPGSSREDVYENVKYVLLTNDHFKRALKKVKPTSSRSSMNPYANASELFAKGHGQEEMNESDDYKNYV